MFLRRELTRVADLKLMSLWQATSFANDVAGAEGIEPAQTVLETVVLPLYDAPIFFGFSRKVSLAVP